MTCCRLSGLRWSLGVERGGKRLTSLLTRGRRGRMFYRAWGCCQPAHQVTHGRRRRQLGGQRLRRRSSHQSTRRSQGHRRRSELWTLHAFGLVVVDLRCICGLMDFKLSVMLM
jgi:hypothetical protein